MTDNYYDTEEGLREWAGFWERFEAGGLEAQFEMAYERPETDPHFDGEFAFELMRQLWASLPDDADTYRRYLDWLEAVREMHPAIASRQRGALLYHELWATCLLDDAEASIDDEEIERLLDAFVEHPAACDATFDVLMYHSEADALADAMPRHWPSIREYADEIGGLSAFAWLALMLNAARAVDRDPTASLEDAWVERIEPVIDAERRDDARRLLDHLAGRSTVDPDEPEIGPLEARLDAVVRLAAEYVGQLIRHEGWHWSRAILVFDMFDEFYRHHLEQVDYEGPETIPPEPNTPLEDRLDATSPVAFHPDEPASYLERFAGRALSPGHQRSAFVASLGGWLDFLVERAFIDEDLADTLREGLVETLEPSLELVFERDADPRMLSNLREALDELSS